MFDLDRFIDDCVRARSAEAEARRGMRDVLLEVMTSRRHVTERLATERAGITLLHHAPDLTIINVIWAPGMQIFAHDHRMWAAIAVYAGREDNQFHRRDRDGTLVATNGKSLTEGDVIVLGDDTIHAVANPARKLTGAIHVYGGDFVNQPRSQWLPPNLTEEAYDAAAVARVFDDANAAWETSWVSN